MKETYNKDNIVGLTIDMNTGTGITYSITGINTDEEGDIVVEYRHLKNNTLYTLNLGFTLRRLNSDKWIVIGREVGKQEENILIYEIY